MPWRVGPLRDPEGDAVYSSMQLKSRSSQLYRGCWNATHTRKIRTS